MYYESEKEKEAFFKSLFQFRMERPLGEGAFGLAILAFDETEKVRKVFKLPRDKKTTEALKTEGANLVKLRGLLHDNIIQLHQYGRTRIQWNGAEEERYYLCLAYGGTSLRVKLGNLKMTLDENGNPSWDGSGKILDLEEGLAISLDICQGLEAAHGFRGSDVRVLHRDIKPANILIDDESGTARITDFGISRVIDRSSGIASAAGTLPYMDPECFQGRAGPYSDLYSLGIVMYEMLTGHLPFKDFPSRLKRPARDPRELSPAIPPSLSAVILKSLYGDVTQRYQSASDMLRDLRRIHAALNPLPPHLVKVEQQGSRCFICDDKETNQRVAVRLVETQTSVDSVAKEIDHLRKSSIAGANLPLGCFRNEQILGIVAPKALGDPLSKALGSLPVTKSTNLTRLSRLLASTSSVLARLHSAGIIHGCLCPGSIYVGKQETITVDGLGLASVLEDRERMSNEALRETFAESLPHMEWSLLEGCASPEARHDLFSIGALLAYFLTGKCYNGPQAVDCALEHKSIVAPDLNPRETNPLVTLRLLTIMRKCLGRPEGGGETYADAGQLAKELDACRWPDDLTDTLCDDAMSKYEAGDAIAAYDILEKALYEDPGSPRVHFTRGIIYFREGEHKWAVPEFENAVNVEPTRQGYMCLVRSLLELGDRINKASRAATRALDFADGPDVRELLAKIRHHQGRQDEAIAQMEQAIDQETEPTKQAELKRILTAWKDGQQQ